MRVHPAVLLVLLALTIPFIVELRTVAVWIGIELTIGQTAVIGALVVGAVIAWALLPEANGRQRLSGE